MKFNHEQAPPGDGSPSAAREKRRGSAILKQTPADAMPASRTAPGRGRLSAFTSLRGRLLLLTVGFVLFAELLIYPLLAAAYRNSWLRERAQAAEIASMAVEAAPDGRVSEELSLELLTRAQVVAVAVTGEDFRELVLAPAVPITGEVVTIDLRGPQGLAAVPETFSHAFAPPGRFLRILFTPSFTEDREMEILIPESALKERLGVYSRNILIISLVTSILVGALVYFAIYGLVVRPMKGLTEAVIRFGAAPDGASIDFQPGGADEMRRAHDALKAMEQAVSSSFRQRKRLAELGESVAKINHDLRNSLATAQIVSESLSQSEDPRVRRAAPRLERAIQRAAALAEATLRYGRAEPPAPRVVRLDAAAAAAEAGEEAIAPWPCADLHVQAPAGGCHVAADPDHLHRIIANLVRNAARAISEQPGRTGRGRITVRIEPQEEAVVLWLEDDGPGLPPRILPHLFQPFAASAARDGTGLGLAISRELARGMRGELVLHRNGPDGACFKLTLPAAR